MSGKLIAIYLKRFRRGPMDSVERANVVAGQGIEGNTDQGGKRQVTVLSIEGWRAALAEIEEDVSPQQRRANLLVEGIELARSRGRVLRVGSTRLRIHGETRPCERMEEAAEGLEAALDPDWRAGIYGEVLEGGELAVGDSVSFEVT